MNRLLELLLGLDRGFLDREGTLSLNFNPVWPWAEAIGNATWNVLLVAAVAALVWWAYRHEARSRRARLILGGLRLSLLILLITLLNRPVLTLTQTRVEPSVLAVMVDDSVSMRVRDIGEGTSATTRLQAVKDLLDPQLLERLSQTHQLEFFRFNTDAAEINAAAMADLDAQGQSTRLGQSLSQVLRNLQGRRVAGVVLLTDGRDTPAVPLSETVAAVSDYDAKLFPIPVGTDRGARNVQMQTADAVPAAFEGDIVTVSVALRGTGVGRDTVNVQLIDKATGAPAESPEGGPAQVQVTFDGEDSLVQAQLDFKPNTIGMRELIVRADTLPGEIDEKDNAREIRVDVVDAKVNVLYVEGYPRWDYRYVKNQLLRDESVVLSVLLTSADTSFRQEGNRPITRFPISTEEMLDYDVLIFGDVDPRQFTNDQLQLVSEWVAEKGGGFVMVAGPQYSPQAYRNTSIEPLLPVDIRQIPPESINATIAEGFRPVITAEGQATSVFRFLPDDAENANYIAERLPPLFWYQQGILAKAGVAEVLAEHPTDTGPDGQPAPLLVLGRYGAGRTLFSAIDDSWRWRFYTGESTFDSYWVQQIRLLARGRKLGQRQITFTSSRPTYELGEQIRLSLRVLDPQLLGQLPDRVDVQLRDSQDALVRTVTLTRESQDGAEWAGSVAADRVGTLVATLPPIAAGLNELTTPVDVLIPRLELADPKLDEPSLSRLASETRGQVIPLAEARERLAAIPSAAARIPVTFSQSLWDSALALTLFLLLITAEWVGRKVAGLV